jgi:hypothetical protein
MCGRTKEASGSGPAEAEFPAKVYTYYYRCEDR